LGGRCNLNMGWKAGDDRDLKMPSVIEKIGPGRGYRGWSSGAGHLHRRTVGSQLHQPLGERGNGFQEESFTKEEYGGP